MFDENMNGPLKKVYPHFNTCVIFTTTSHTFHGHPDPLVCPKNRSRKSIALYYFSSGRPKNESITTHGTLFRERNNEIFKSKTSTNKILNFLKKIF